MTPKIAVDDFAVIFERVFNLRKKGQASRLNGANKLYVDRYNRAGKWKDMDD